ncbi:MAG: energy transducer TonB [Paludibacteraceae bacterium]|nr:energy transducer TonB [Paludibacteraceae bacterium]
MKRLFLICIALLAVSLMHAEVDYLMYEAVYAKCVDDEPSDIYGGTYHPYPQGMYDAKFPGGDVELSLYLYQNTEMPDVFSGEIDIDGKPLLLTGEVKVQVVVDRCGHTCCYEILQSLSEEQDQAALKVVKSLPTFKPASLDGYRVKSAYILPVKFNKKRQKEPEPQYDDYNYDDYYNNYDW